MTTVTVSGAGAHASAAATDRIPASKGPFTPGTKGYLTAEQIRALIISTANAWSAAQSIAMDGPEFRITSTTNNNASVRFAHSNSSLVGYMGRLASQYGIFDGGAGMILGFSTASLVQWFGTTSSFPALKRSTTILQGRLADDSGFCVVQAIHRTHANAVSETPSATHTIAIQDAAGTAYKVLAVAA